MLAVQVFLMVSMPWATQGPGQGLGQVQYMCTDSWEGCSHQADIQLTVLASSSHVARKISLHHAQVHGTTAFQACLACVALDLTASCLGSQHLNWSRVASLHVNWWEVWPHQCLPLHRGPCWVASGGPVLFCLSVSAWWSCTCQKVVEHVRGNRGGVRVDWKEEVVCSRAWS